MYKPIQMQAKKITGYKPTWMWAHTKPLVKLYKPRAYNLDFVICDCCFSSISYLQFAVLGLCLILQADKMKQIQNSSWLPAWSIWIHPDHKGFPFAHVPSIL